MADGLQAEDLQFPQVRVTKRSILIQVFMLSDPLGFLSSYTLLGKC